MKYLYLIVIIFLLTSCYSIISDDIEDYNYLPDNSIRFIRTDNETSILINKDDIYYLLLLNDQNIDIEVDYLIKYKEIETDIDYEQEYLLEDTLAINNLEFKLNNKIEVSMNNQNLCIYIKEIDEDDYSNCNYIYLYNPDKNFYITLNNDLLILFYHSYTKFNYKFMRHLTTVWIDSYTIDSSSYTTLTFDEDDFIVTSDKIRNKTIHKKQKS